MTPPLWQKEEELKSLLMIVKKESEKDHGPWSHHFVANIWGNSGNSGKLYFGGGVLIALPEKAMAPHSSTLAWKIPWMEEPGRLQSMGATKSRTRLSDFTFTFHFHALEKEMATHSSVLAWRSPEKAEPGGLLLWGRTESETTEVT